jgi:hypothetical protein
MLLVICWGLREQVADCWQGDPCLMSQSTLTWSSNDVISVIHFTDIVKSCLVRSA